jgi:hypothetical protein
VSHSHQHRTDGIDRTHLQRAVCDQLSRNSSKDPAHLLTILAHGSTYWLVHHDQRHRYSGSSHRSCQRFLKESIRFPQPSISWQCHQKTTRANPGQEKGMGAAGRGAERSGRGSRTQTHHRCELMHPLPRKPFISNILPRHRPSKCDREPPMTPPTP